jgi:hypothetical protein
MQNKMETKCKQSEKRRAKLGETKLNSNEPIGSSFSVSVIDCLMYR